MGNRGAPPSPTRGRAGGPTSFAGHMRTDLSPRRSGWRSLNAERAHETGVKAPAKVVATKRRDLDALEDGLRALLTQPARLIEALDCRGTERLGDSVRVRAGSSLGGVRCLEVLRVTHLIIVTNST